MSPSPQDAPSPASTPNTASGDVEPREAETAQAPAAAGDEVRPGTGFGVDETALEPTAQDLRVLTRMLGRPVRDVVEIPARCVCGNPLVAATAPRLSGGSPFPTVFYLAHPGATQATSRLEAAGVMAQMTERLGRDERLAAAYRAAHEDYLARRARIGRLAGTGEVPEIEGISAGGMPVRVKCLHALLGHTLAVGTGINPLGDETLEAVEPSWSPHRCACDPAWRDQD